MCDFLKGFDHIALGIAILGVFLILMSGDLDNPYTRDGAILKAGLCVIPLLVVASQPEQQSHPFQQMIAIGLSVLFIGLALWYAWPLGDNGWDDGDDDYPEGPTLPESGIDWDLFDQNRRSWDRKPVR